MDQELKTLVETLQDVAYQAGYALLNPERSDRLEEASSRLRCACRRLRAFYPSVACLCTLPEDASPGDVRLAARDAATFVRRMHTTSYLQRSAA